MKKSRLYTLDIMRIFAILAVVMIHSSYEFLLDGYVISDSNYFIANVLDTISRFGVPFFVMISGALLLDEDKRMSWNIVLKKYVFNILILLFFWSLFYSIIYQIIFPVIKLKSVNAISILDFVDALINGHFHLWYLYMIIGLYLMTPLLRKFVDKDNEKSVIIFILISVLIQFTEPLFQLGSIYYQPLTYVSEFINKFQLQFFCGYTTYYILGWYIVHIGVKGKCKTRLLYLLGCTGLIGTITLVQITKNIDLCHSNMSILILLYSVSLFVFFTNFDTSKFSEKTRMNLIKLSSFSFGVYAIHPLIWNICRLAVSYTDDMFLYICIMFFVVLFISYILVFIISKIPYLKKIIKG